MDVSAHTSFILSFILYNTMKSIVCLHTNQLLHSIKYEEYRPTQAVANSRVIALM